ncbi:hypothetical protein KR215_007574 [Drosophila sulfurigaster]|nr:hypothetical protein KR215_007574 [Drosophila sulfurigaster]
MSGVQLKDSALKAKEKTNEPATKAPITTTTTTTTATTIAKKTLTSSAALSLFDQLKNGVNLNSLTVGGATETTKATAATVKTAAATAVATTATAATLAPPATPPPNIDLKPPPKPLKASSATRTFNTPILLPLTSSIGIVHGTKRGRDNSNGNDNDNCAAPATLSHCRTAAGAAAKLDINALRSQLYQGARKTATTTKPTATATAATSTKRATATTSTTAAATATTTTAAAAARGDRGGIRASANGNSTKKRCLDRYDSSESSDR